MPTYGHLNMLQREIRLISLQPRHVGDEIECDIKIVNLDTKPLYEALSYECEL